MTTAGYVGRSLRSIGLVGLFAFSRSVSTAWADPVVLSNVGDVSGFAQVRLIAEPFGTPLALETFGTRGPVALPPQGSSVTLADTATVIHSGATSTSASSLMTTLSPTRLSFAGSTMSLTTGPPSPPEVFFSSAGRSFVAIAFELLEPHTYSFTGQYSAESFQTEVFFAFEVLEGHVVRTVFADFFRGQPSFLSTRTGIVAPGRYFLSGRMGAFTNSSSEDSNANASLNIGLDFAPTPEPTTLVLLGVGLLGLVRPRRKRKLP
jgi:PEP-CTERM motif-containing protein